MVYERLGEVQKALASYARVIHSQGPEADSRLLAEALSSRASLYESLRKRQEARADLKKALDLAPADWARRSEAFRRLKSLAN